MEYPLVYVLERFDMSKQSRLFITWVFVLSVSREAELRTNLGLIEDTGDPSLDMIASYLEYEEPEYNQKKGFTADDFTDGLVGYQTLPSHARSFGWETSGYGEVPYAALLVSHQRNKYCMGTVVTVTAVVTPCGCVRSMGFRDHHVTDFDINGKVKDKHKFYEYDVGLDVDVVANRVEYNPDHVGTNVYPHVMEVIADKCFEFWNHNIKPEGNIGYDPTKIYTQNFFPAISKLSGVLEFDAPAPWPPFRMKYSDYSNFTMGRTLYHYCYNRFNLKGDEEPTSAIISSYKFIPLEDSDLTRDNDGRGRIPTENRLVNLRVELCNQRLCNSSDVYRVMNNYLFHGEKLDKMSCWCDEPWLGDEKIYVNLRNDEVPVYFKSVHGGIVGAPVIHNGDWVGWIVERVSRNASKRVSRPTWSRGVDDEIFNFLQEKIPELKNAYRPKVNDVNRLRFAIHDFKDFVPDADLKVEDLDLQDWVQDGNPRFAGPKKQLRYFSGVPTFKSTPVLSVVAGMVIGL